MSKYFTFHQNNSFGSWCGPKHVIIEAESAAEANEIAERKGTIYFHGCALGKDCPCCGDRWVKVTEEEGTTAPEIYGKPWTNYDFVTLIGKNKE